MILEQTNRVLRARFGFYFTTVQIEHDCTNPGIASAIDFADPHMKGTP